MTDSPVHVLAQPFTAAELEEFEALIFASNLNHHQSRLHARADLADFLAEHGKEKCDLMLAELTRKHEQPSEH